MANSDRPFNKENYDLDSIRILIDLNANSVDKPVFIADRAYRTLQIEEIHSVAGGAAATAALRKCTGTTAPASGALLSTSTFDLTAAANTTQTATLTATAADRDLADGDKVAIDMSGTLTNLVGVVTLVLAKL